MSLLAVLYIFSQFGTELVSPTYAQSSFRVPVYVISYIPITGEGGLDLSKTGYLGVSSLIELRSRINSVTNQGINNLEAATKYHGYKDPTALISLDYSIYKQVEYLEDIVRSTNQIPWNPGVYRPDYRGMLERENICNAVDNNGVKEVWIWGYHYADLEPVESVLVMGYDSREYWNYPDYGIDGNTEHVNAFPICQKSYSLFNMNYGRGLSELLENHTHHIEAILGNDPFMWDLFVNPHGQRGGVINACGWTHCPPNVPAGNDYNWYSETTVLSNCANWRPDGSGTVQYVNCHTWSGLTCSDDGGARFKIWWMQNIPGLNNGLLDPGGSPLRNWWEFIADFDYAMDKGILLSNRPSAYSWYNPNPPVVDNNPLVPDSPSVNPSQGSSDTPIPTPVIIGEVKFAINTDKERFVVNAGDTLTFDLTVSGISNVANELIKWASNIDGELCVGTSCTLKNLSIGVHKISVTYGEYIDTLLLEVKLENEPNYPNNNGYIDGFTGLKAEIDTKENTKAITIVFYSVLIVLSFWGVLELIIRRNEIFSGFKKIISRP
ncbi:hypothetical protein JW962_00475 [Candidatus Dojkabacteria bacterium]|nr:hypothetical protein [Candidatus Dojkabacteria bacterium]